MDRHTCNLCFRRFSNGRALGGHMRSHVTTKQPPLTVALNPSGSSSSYKPPDEVEGGDQVPVAGGDGRQETKGHYHGQTGGTSYGLRENPRKSIRLADLEFSSAFAAAADYGYFFASEGVGDCSSSALVVQDWESETESSKVPFPPFSRRRTKRPRRRCPVLPLPKQEEQRSCGSEPVSSVSNTSPDEDVAFCLVMLSRDAWKRKEQYQEEQEKEHQLEDEEQVAERAGASRSRQVGREKYRCGTCRKTFRSYQALGGHRSSHKKARPFVASSLPSPAAVTSAASPIDVDEEEYNNCQDQMHDLVSDAAGIGPRIYECPFCFRIFASGQALGGHKRSHFASAPPAHQSALVFNAVATGGEEDGKLKLGEGLIDLNLPAPVEKFHYELSDVSIAD